VRGWSVLSLVCMCALCARAGAQPAEEREIGATEPGVTLWVWDLGSWELEDRLDRWPTVAEGQTPNVYANFPRIDFAERIETPEGELDDMFAGRVWGWLRIDEAGEYAFRLRGDDGARLILDGVVQLDTDWGHRFTVTGSMALDAGLHRLEIPFYEDYGRFYVSLEWKPPGAEDWALVPRAHLVTEAGQTFVTSPGKKRFFFGEDPNPAGDARPLEGVHPAFELEPIRPEGFEPAVGGMVFLPDGRLAVCTWDTDGAVYILDGLHEPGAEVTASRFASGLGEPLGLAVVGGALCAAQKQEITRLTDVDGDGVAERYEAIASGWPASHNYHEFTFNLVTLNGTLYTCTSVPLRSGSTQYLPGSETAYPVGPGPGSVVEIDPRTGEWEVFAGGLRTPNGLAIGVDGELFGCDNQGSWLPSSRVNHIRRGGFYGHQTEPDGNRPADPPVAWMPQGEIGNSPSRPALVPDGPYKGQMLVGDVTHGGIKRLFVEKVDGVYQGAVFRFSQGLEAGVNRLLWGPDGALYVGGIGADGNWHHEHKRFGLQRLRPTGETPFEMLRVESRRDGLLVTFTEAVDRAILENPHRYQVLTWKYVPTMDYGAPQGGTRRLAVTDAVASPDGTQVYLELPGLEAEHVVHIRLVDVESRAGRRPWSTECWYTLNRISDEIGPGFADRSRDMTGVLRREPPEGAVVLFDGADASELVMRDDGGPVTWPVRFGNLVVDQAAGDILSKRSFGDCLLHVEWFSPPGGSAAAQRNGNSGVKLQGRYEIQILATPGPPHAIQFNEAGSIYRIKAADVNASAGPGAWQTYDIWFTAPRWEDGEKVVNARMTVCWNGILVHEDVEVPRQTGVSVPEAPGDHPILLQAHPSDAVDEVRFRNVWVLPDPGGHGLAPPRSGEGSSSDDG